jgi:hypothetical protein
VIVSEPTFEQVTTHMRRTRDAMLDAFREYWLRKSQHEDACALYAEYMLRQEAESAKQIAGQFDNSENHDPSAPHASADDTQCASGVASEHAEQACTCGTDLIHDVGCRALEEYRASCVVKS